LDKDSVVNPSRKSAIFIDGQNLHFTARSLGFDIDFKRLLAQFGANEFLLRAYYYTTIIQDANYHSIRPLTDFLAYNGYTVVAKPAREFDDGEGRRKVKRNVSLSLAVDVLELASRLDHMVLISGDGDFRSVVEAVQRRGVHVSVVSSPRTNPAMISDDLRRQADTFIELDDLRVAIGRPLKSAPAAR
jgi:uncharacterized LabA/DUF88 family protein